MDIVIVTWNKSLLWVGDKNDASYHESDSDYKLLRKLFIENKVEYYSCENTVHREETCDDSLIYTCLSSILECHHNAELE